MAGLPWPQPLERQDGRESVVTTTQRVNKKLKLVEADLREVDRRPRSTRRKECCSTMLEPQERGAMGSKLPKRGYKTTLTRRPREAR